MSLRNCLAAVLLAAFAAGPAHALDETQAKQVGQSEGARGAQAAPGAAEAGTTVNQTLGHEATQPTGSGSGDDRGFTSSARYEGKLACAEGRTVFLGGLGLKVLACERPGAIVASLQLAPCFTARDGAACQWGSPQTVSNPGTATFPGFRAQLQCPAGSQICNVTVFETASASWNADTLNNQAQAAAQSQAAGGFQDQLNTTYNDGGYRASLSAVGPQHGACVEQVNTGLASDGVVYTCDGSQNASFDANCEETRECLRTEQQITRYDVDCVSGVDLVQQTCTTVTPTKDCTVNIEKQTYSCNKTLTVKVTSSGGTPSCVQGTWFKHWSVNIFGRADSHFDVYGYCDTNRTDGKMQFQFKQMSFGSWYPVVHAQDVVIDPGPGSYTYLNPGFAYRGPGQPTNCEDVYYTGDCNGNNCAFTFRYRNTCSTNPTYRGPWYINATFEKPNKTVTYTYTDTWADGCTSYENAK